MVVQNLTRAGTWSWWTCQKRHNWICLCFRLSLLAAASGLCGAIFDMSCSLGGKSPRAALLYISLTREPDGRKAKHVVHHEKKSLLQLLFVLFLMWKSHSVGMEQLLTAALARASEMLRFEHFNLPLPSCEIQIELNLKQWGDFSLPTQAHKHFTWFSLCFISSLLKSH